MISKIRRSVAALTLALLALVSAGSNVQAASDSSYQANVYIQQGGTALVVKTAGGPGILNDNGPLVFSQRIRTSTANVNTGATLLPAITGYKYRLISCKAIAVGGAAGAVTTVDILATQSAGSVKLVAYAQASLTQSTVLTDGGSGGTVLADGASYVQNDISTAITIGKTGASMTTATNIDVIITYAIE